MVPDTECSCFFPNWPPQALNDRATNIQAQVSLLTFDTFLKPMNNWRDTDFSALPGQEQIDLATR
jgi:hypothetical protein